MNLRKVIGNGLLFLFLTIVTQIGGVVLLCWLPVGRFIEKRIKNRFITAATKTLVFSGLYLITTFVFVPILAKSFGRVALPVWHGTTIQPLTLWTCLLNRHYVNPTLKMALEKVALQINKEFPGTQVAYLDANFPFLNQFPLFPHLSHNDGRKVDLAFFYQHTVSGKQLSREAPSFIG